MRITQLLFVFLLVFTSFTDMRAQLPEDHRSQFEEIVNLVETHFYDTAAISGSEWKNAVELAREQVNHLSGRAMFDKEINSLLAKLNTSHTYYFSKANPKRYQLLGVFYSLYEQDREDLFIYEGIGIDTRLVNGQHVIISVFDGFPAHQAGLKYGDHIVSVNDSDFHPIESFRNQPGAEVKIIIERLGKQIQFNVPVEKLDGRTMFETAAEASARLIDHAGKKIGYIHLWSYAGSHYQDLLREKVLWGELSRADALVLDLHDGWGGADLNYLNLFREPIATVASRDREGSIGSYSGVWEKPVALLVNERSTSGKELFAYGFKKLNLGPVVGTTTAGAVVAGRIFLLSSGDVLYLAVRDVSVDGTRLEGNGVTPDVKVDRDFSNPSQIDPQLQKALEAVARLIK